MFLLNTKTEWNDYFSEISPSQTYGPKLFTTTLTSSGPNVYVSNCLFSKCTSTNNGGAISCTSVKYLLIESSTFFSCNTSASNGGAIYITGINECILYKVCSNGCCSTYSGGSSSGQFAHITTNNAASDKNYFNYSSITRCLNEITGSWYNLRLQNGKICCPSINISMNKCYMQPIFFCYGYVSNFVTCLFTYSSFVDNNATAHNCIAIGTTSEIDKIKCCNILRNTQVVLGSRGIILSNGNLTLKDSCILENKANCIFYGSSSSMITLSNCTVDSVTYYNSFTIQNTVTKSFLHALNHISTQNCHSGYDSVGSLTAIPLPTSKEKIKYCFTYKIIRARISDFFSFICLFIFTFIQSYI
jgi:predicted outer membrane repeat protein